MSIGDRDFAQRLAEGQAVAAGGDVQHPAAGEGEPEWLSGPPPAGLEPVPEQTQQEDYNCGSDDDDYRKEELKKKYSDLNSKTYRMKELMTKQATMANQAGPDPYDLMEKMHDDVDAIEDDDEKTYSSQMYNAIYAQYESARKNEDLRNFLADVFGGLRDHYDTKEEKVAIKDEIKILTELYNEQEEEQMLAALAKKREDRKLALETKAAAKAKKLEARPPAKRAKSKE